jgi:hypothetical protein
MEERECVSASKRGVALEHSSTQELQYSKDRATLKGGRARLRPNRAAGVIRALRVTPDHAANCRSVAGVTRSAGITPAARFGRCLGA